MGAKRLLGFGVKWLVIPAAIAAAGYFYVGPELGAPRTDDPPVVPLAAKPVPESSKLKRTTDGPEVEVSAKKTETPKPKRKRKRKPTVKPAEPAVAPAVESNTSAATSDN